MPMIPPEILPQLDDLGIVEPAASQWRWLPSRPDWPHHAPCTCDRHDPHSEFELALTRLGGRRIFIGQCPTCRFVFVQDAVKS